MSIFATQEQVDALRLRAQEWENAGFPTADIHIPGLISLMNRFENIACIWSCEGHRDDENNRDFYLMLAVTEEGFETLTRFYSKARDRLLADSVAGQVRLAEYQANAHNVPMPKEDPVKYSKVTNFRMSFTSRIWGWPDLVTGKIDSTQFYNVIILTGETGPVSVKEVFFDHLIESAQELLASYED